MANTDRVFGLRPVGTLGQTGWTGKINMYVVLAADATATFVGDLVDLSGTSGAAGVVVNGIDIEGLPAIAQGVAGGPHVGVVVGFLPDQDNLMRKHRVASTNRIALVSDDPATIYEIQEVSGGTALTATEVSLNANVVVAAGNATTGLSGMELDNSTEATTAGLDVRIIGLVRRPDNNFGEHAKRLVTIMDHRYRAGVAGV